MFDPVALAEAAQDALDRFGELTGCAEFGDDWSCTQLATPDRPARSVGRDDRGCEVWIRRWRCVAGHWYDLETLPPDRDEWRTMKRIRIERPKVRKERRNDPLSLDPRDPDILRAKQLMDVPRSHHEGGSRA